MNNSLERVQGLTKALFDKLIDCIRKATIIEKMLFSQNNYEAKTDSWKVAFINIRASLFNDYIASIANLLSDRDSRSLSLRNLHAMIFTNEEIKEKLCQEYKIVRPEDPVMIGNLDSVTAENIRKQIENDILVNQQRQLEMLWPKLEKDIGELLNSNISKKIHTYRCKIIAHYEIDPSGLHQALVRPDEIRLNWGDPFNLLEKAEMLVLELYLLLNNGSVQLSSQFRS